MLSRAAVRRLYFVRFTRGHHKFSPTKPRTSFPFVPFAVRLTFFQGRSTVAWSVVLMVAIRWLLGLTSWYSGGSVGIIVVARQERELVKEEVGFDDGS